jgi:SAM-dependent methyltransferase
MQTEQFQLHAQIEERHWWFVARRRILTAVVNAVLPPSTQTTIIDVGCGTGANLAGLADAYECIGIDASSEAVKLARGRFPRVRFIHGLAPKDLGHAIDRARLILLTDVLEHVADDFAMFSELLAAAQPGTYFLLTVPADPALWSDHDRAFGHYRRYDAPRFEQIWQGLAVEQIFVSHFNSRLYPLVKSIRYVNRWRGRTGGQAGTDFVLPNPLANDFLTRCFAGEQRRLVRLAQGQPASPYHSGVSLMALVRRESGPIARRVRPSNVTADDFDPAADLVTAEA